MQHYFAKTFANNRFRLDPSDERHVLKVMRNRVGDRIVCVWQRRFYLCALESTAPLTAVVERTIEEDNELPVDTTVYLALIKPGAFELAVQKLVELGADRIVAVRFTQSQKYRLSPLRLNRIAKEAAEQAHRNHIPAVEADPLGVAAVAQDQSAERFVLDLDGNCSPKDLSFKKGSLAVAIGPEGGMTAAELKLLAQAGFKRLKLGKTVLRSETAAIAFMALASQSVG